MKVAIVHDWLTGMRGGEKVLEALLELFPDADLYTLFHIKGTVSKIIEARKIQTSFLQKMPGLQKYYRFYLPLFPLAIESLTIKTADLVISSSHCVAKGISLPSSIPHICYCYTPMRYLWAMTDDYFTSGKGIVGHAFRWFTPTLKRWDLKSNQSVSHFIGISNHISQRIETYYHRQADVIYPPVETDLYCASLKREPFYLIVSALVPYKRIDLAIEAFNRLNLPLIIIGKGPEEKKLKKMAHQNIQFLGWQSQPQLSKFLATCRAFIFPGEEDFGIAPVEAMASGRPVIAYGKGGALETVTKETGIFFYSQTPEALCQAVEDFENHELLFQAETLQCHAKKFDKSVFKQKFSDTVERFLG